MGEIEGTHYVDAQCVTCGTYVVCVPGYEDNARCIEDARDFAGCGDRSPFDAVGEWHPTVRYGTYAVDQPIPEPTPYPSPEYVGTVVEYPNLFGTAESRTPAPVLSLAGYAFEYGWKVHLQYSRGYFPHGTTGKPTAVRHVIGLRFGDHPDTTRQAYAVYSASVSSGAWSWTSIQIWGPDLPPYGGCGMSELKAYLHEVGARSNTEAMLSWVADLRTVAANSEALRKYLAAQRKGDSFTKPREGAS